MDWFFKLAFVCVWVCFVFQMVVSSSQSSARVHDFELCSSHGCNSRRSRTSFDSKHRLVFMRFGTLTQTFILPFPMEDTSCIILTATRIMRSSRYLMDSFFVCGPWSVQCSPKQKNIASKKQHKDHHRSPSSSAAAKLRLFDKFRDMQQRWHPDFEEEVGKTVRGGLALCNFKPWRKKETGSCSSSRALTWATVGVLSFSIPKDCIRFCDSELSVWWFMYSRVCRMVILKDLMRHQGHLRAWYSAQLWRRKWVSCCLSLSLSLCPGCGFVSCVHASW